MNECCWTVAVAATKCNHSLECNLSPEIGFCQPRLARSWICGNWKHGGLGLPTLTAFKSIHLLPFGCIAKWLFFYRFSIFSANPFPLKCSHVWLQNILGNLPIIQKSFGAEGHVDNGEVHWCAMDLRVVNCWSIRGKEENQIKKIQIWPLCCVCSTRNRVFLASRSRLAARAISRNPVHSLKAKSVLLLYRYVKRVAWLNLILVLVQWGSHSTWSLSTCQYKEIA